MGWFVKGETLGLVLMELDTNFDGKVFTYKLQQAGQPNPDILPFSRGTGRPKFSHAIPTSALNYQPYGVVEIAGVGPNGERMIGIDTARAAAADIDSTVMTVTILGTTTPADTLTGILSVVGARGGAFLGVGIGISGTGGTGGNIPVEDGTGTQYFIKLIGSDDFTLALTGVPGSVLDSGLSITFTGKCACWKRYPAAGFWKRVSDYSTTLLTAVNLTLRNPNNDLAVPSATDIIVCNLQNPYDGWCIRQAMLNTTSLDYITPAFDQNLWRTGVYGSGVHIGLRPIDVTAYQSFVNLSQGNPDGSQGITDVWYPLEGGGPDAGSQAGSKRMYEVFVGINCTVVQNASSNQGCNCERNCMVRWLYYGNDPTENTRQSVADPLVFIETCRFAAFYPTYERLDDNAEIPSIYTLIKELDERFMLNYIAPPPMTTLAPEFDGGGQQAKVEKEGMSKKPRSVGSTLEKVKALVEGRNISV